MFRRTFLPANTPIQFSQKLYDVYGLNHSSREMNFDDFLEVYYLVHFDGQQAHKSVASRRAQLYFHIFKQHGGSASKKGAITHDISKQDYFNSNLIMAVGTQYFNMTDQQVTQFLQNNGLQPNQKVTLCKLLIQSKL